MISGGQGTNVELISPTGHVSCSVPDLPKRRYGHTMDNNIVCGGSVTLGADIAASCDQLTSAGWTRSHTLIHRRYSHSSWEVEDGIILLGGSHSGTTSEIAKWDGTTEELFRMRYPILYIHDYSLVGNNLTTQYTFCTGEPVPSLTLTTPLWW